MRSNRAALMSIIEAAVDQQKEKPQEPPATRRSRLFSSFARTRWAAGGRVCVPGFRVARCIHAPSAPKTPLSTRTVTEGEHPCASHGGGSSAQASARKAPVEKRRFLCWWLSAEACAFEPPS